HVSNRPADSSLWRASARRPVVFGGGGGSATSAAPSRRIGGGSGARDARFRQRSEQNFAARRFAWNRPPQEAHSTACMGWAPSACGALLRADGHRTGVTHSRKWG